MSELTTEERYAIAISSTNLRVEADKGGAGDVLIAVGWSPSRLGSALMRLQSEYDGIEKPRPVCLDGLVKMALKHKKQNPSWKQKECEAAAMADSKKWLANEKQLFLGKLKTLPAVIEQITVQAAKWRIEQPIRVSTVIIGHWLNQVCPECNGVKFELIKDTPSASSKVCRVCQGVGVTATPYGGDGKRLANYLDDCRSRAIVSIRGRLREKH